MATSFAGNSRSLDLREMPMNNVSRVEVTKVPTPDMSASGLGGSINLISRNGFEVKKRRILFNAYTQFHNRNGLTFDGGPRNHNSANSPDFIQPSFDFSYLQPINRNLAITVGGARTWRFKPMETGTKRPTSRPPGTSCASCRRRASGTASRRPFAPCRAPSASTGASAPTDSISAAVNFRDYGLYITRSVLGFNYGANATGGPTFTQGAPTAVGVVTMNGSGENVDITTQTKHYTLKYRHRGDLWRWDERRVFRSPPPTATTSTPAFSTSRPPRSPASSSAVTTFRLPAARFPPATAPRAPAPPSMSTTVATTRSATRRPPSPIGTLTRAISASIWRAIFSARFRSRSKSAPPSIPTERPAPLLEDVGFSPQRLHRRRRPPRQPLRCVR
jgi:hypothetical protein